MVIIRNLLYYVNYYNDDAYYCKEAIGKYAQQAHNEVENDELDEEIASQVRELDVGYLFRQHYVVLRTQQLVSAATADELMREFNSQERLRYDSFSVGKFLIPDTGLFFAGVGCLIAYLILKSIL